MARPSELSGCIQCGRGHGGGGLNGMVGSGMGIQTPLYRMPCSLEDGWAGGADWWGGGGMLSTGPRGLCVADGVLVLRSARALRPCRLEKGAREPLGAEEGGSLGAEVWGGGQPTAVRGPWGVW